MSSIATLLEAAEYIERCERETKWQDLPDELILKILSYSEVIDLISCGQVSKRTRNISRDTSLWVTANLEDYMVKTELLELILSKGCKILNLSDSTIVGSLSSNIKSQLRVLNLSQYGWGFPAKNTGPHVGQIYYEENIDTIEALLFSCGSLHRLEMKGLLITPKMSVSICLNGKTLQVLNLKSSFVDESGYPYTDGYYQTVPNGNFQTIIKCCQDLKEVDLNCINGNIGIPQDNLEFLIRNISPNVEKLNLINHDIWDDHVKTLLSRCNKIQALKLEAYFMTDDSMPYIIQYLNLTLEELSLVDDGVCDNVDRTQCISFSGLLKLKSMPKLKILNLLNKQGNCEEIQNLREHLPHIKILRDHSTYR